MMNYLGWLERFLCKTQTLGELCLKIFPITVISFRQADYGFMLVFFGSRLQLSNLLVIQTMLIWLLTFSTLQ